MNRGGKQSVGCRIMCPWSAPTTLREDRVPHVWQKNAARGHLQVQDLRAFVSCALHGATDPTSQSRQQKYSAHSFLCQLVGQMARERDRAINSPTRSRGVLGDTSAATCKAICVQHLPIIDVMGVCDHSQNSPHYGRKG